MNHVIHALSSTDIRVFSPEMSKVQYIKKIQVQITFWYIISNSFNIFWVLKDCFNKNDYNFDDVKKIIYSRSS